MEKPVTISGNKPHLDFWQIWNMSFGFLGIQFGWGLQLGNMSAIYEYLGAQPDELPILWLAAPMTGLLVQPIIGYYSDRTWTKLGRRKPYFLTGAILASLALILMPHSSALWMAAGLLWILDASINISMEPFRAFVADMMPKEQVTRGYTMQSFFIGVGAVLAAVFPYFFTEVLGMDKTSAVDSVPTYLKYSFAVGGLAFFGAVLWTVVKTKEYPPDDLEAFQKMKAESSSP
ncbi:MAG: MFS transporter, partial [Bacteroidetes bacterium]